MGGTHAGALVETCRVPPMCVNLCPPSPTFTPSPLNETPLPARGRDERREDPEISGNRTEYMCAPYDTSYVRSPHAPGYLEGVIRERT